MEITPYIRKTYYYETDQMGIIHHSNYIRWFEEARAELMEQLGYSYARMENEGVASPLLHVECDYKTMARFGETVRIYPMVTHFNGVRMTVSYKIYDNATGALRTTGLTRHCFTKGNRPVSLKKEMPALYTLFSKYVAEQQAMS